MLFRGKKSFLFVPFLLDSFIFCLKKKKIENLHRWRLFDFICASLFFFSRAENVFVNWWGYRFTY